MVQRNNSTIGQKVMELHNSKGFILREEFSLIALPTNDNKSPKNEHFKRIITGIIILGSLLFLAYL